MPFALQYRKRDTLRLVYMHQNSLIPPFYKFQKSFLVKYLFFIGINNITIKILEVSHAA